MVFLTALEMNQALWGLALGCWASWVLARAVIVHVDWSLLLVFMVMFIDVHLLTQLPALHQVLSGVGTLSGGGLWLTAIGLSPVISNVPSTILLLNYVPPSILLAWAVNVGGFGLLPGLAGQYYRPCVWPADRRIWWRFHLYPFQCCYGRHFSGYWLFKLSARSQQNRAIIHIDRRGSPFGAIFLSGSQKPIPAFAYFHFSGI